MIGNIVSWNVRRTNNKDKRLVINGCLKKWMPSLVCMQETKMEDHVAEKCKSIWCNKNSDLHVIPAKGSTGGMITCWKKDWFSCLDVFKGECTLSCIFKN